MPRRGDYKPLHPPDDESPFQALGRSAYVVGDEDLTEILHAIPELRP